MDSEVLAELTAAIRGLAAAFSDHADALREHAEALRLEHGEPDEDESIDG